MSLLIGCQSISKSFGTRLLFSDLSLSVFSGDKIGLIGLNGSGKSTLLQILAGLDRPDSGAVTPKKGLKIGLLPQSSSFEDKKPQTILFEALDPVPIPLHEKEKLVDVWMGKFGFTGNEPSAALLSGGWKKRLALARELVLSPDLLLLDEPTNHLDLEGILWLERFLLEDAPTYLLVSHDRYFLQTTAKRVIEIDPVYPKGSFAVDGSYSEFLSKKEQFIQGQIEKERSIATKSRRETDWLRQGAKARTTKSQARIEKAHEILEEHAQIRARNRKTTAKIDFEATERETRKLVAAKNLSKELGGRLLFRHLDFTLSPGTRIGLMGPNGSGKTTLLRILAGEIAPDQGTLKKAEGLKTVYFDQHRVQLPLTLSLQDALSPDGDYVLFRGQRIHINGWCKRFLFSPDILPLPIGKLSGGERARISIARLILEPADLLLLDEPTNDLDIPTLEALEESLIDFPGAVMLITHDRCMLDRICTSLLALGSPEKSGFFSDFAQWEAAQAKEEPSQLEKEGPSKGKLSYQEKKELDALERKISKLEEEVKTLNHRLEEPMVAENPKTLEEVCRAIGLAETQIEQAYIRWHELSK